MRLTGRVDKVAKRVAGRPRPGVFHVVEAVPVHRADGRAPGLYRDGPPGSLAGTLVYDPARGEPVVPDGALAPFGLLLVLGLDHLDPPAPGPVDAREPGNG
ncbi:hypothetical protein R5W23_004896 [Gemmata sp. JC673]|uniref:Uncharacterized protein n=1 Tax=Gemmata algarum TaxID=2975278 RepID=A0ABU5F8E8_9BACT|nr:hypothetical protein [Gemmata algarum]MDY3563393.1 hypothetical protein [Gemmata algarum]